VLGTWGGVCWERRVAFVGVLLRSGTSEREPRVGYVPEETK
jgi:hypothetical protein